MIPHHQLPWDEVGRRLQHGDGSSSLSEVTAPAGVAILSALDVRAGARGLEVGCGRGDFLALAAQHGIDIVGVDLAPQMVRATRARYPGASAIVGDGAALPFVDGAFDVVVCSFTLGFVADRGRAVAEARRVLAPGGRYALTTWQLGSGGFLAFVEDAVRRHGVDGEAAFASTNPGPSYYVDLLVSAGFGDVRVTPLDLAIRCARASGVLEVLRTTGKARALIESQRPDARERIEAELVSRMERVREDEFHMPMPAFLVHGTR
jgi:SAM-dependent methyltransferase